MSWWNKLYDEWLAEMLLVREDESDTSATLDFLMRELQLTQGDRAFDQCFGIGSLAIPMAKRGIEVVGVELCESYVARAREEAVRFGLNPVLEQGDAFEFVCAQPVQGAFNWWTSFGYAPDDATNAQMLARAFDSLSPGGRFALDFMNLPGVLRGFKPEHELRRNTPFGEVALVRESEVDLSRGVLHKIWTYHLPDGREVRHESDVRLYMPWDLADLAHSVGFDSPRFHGGVRGEPLTMDAPRCILVVEKPEKVAC